MRKEAFLEPCPLDSLNDDDLRLSSGGSVSVERMLLLNCFFPLMVVECVLTDLVEWLLEDACGAVIFPSIRGFFSLLIDQLACCCKLAE